MSSGAFAPVGAKAGLTHDAGRTSFSPDPLSAACLSACRLEFALDRRDRDRQRQARTRGSSPDARHRPGEQHFGVPPPTQVGARNRRLVGARIQAADYADPTVARKVRGIESTRKGPLMQAPTTRPLTTFEPETGAMTPVTLQTRELAARENDRIHVLLLWRPRQDAATVSVDDTRGGHRFDLAVARDRALEAFHHPFAYAAANSDGVL